MRGRARARLAAGLLVLGLGALGGGCSPEDDRPDTGILLVVDADDALRVRLRRVEIEVQSWAAGGVPESRTPVVFKGEDGLEWPIRGRLVPSSGDASRQYRVTARAYESTSPGDVLVVARAQSGYVSGQWRRLTLFLVETCSGVRCGDGESCRAGACAPEAVDPETLPVVVAGDGGADAATDGGIDGAADGATDGGLDGSADGGGDVDGATDGGTDGATDAMPECASDADCDDGNPCTRDMCNDGSCAHEPAASGTSCDDPAGGMCDGMGACVQCLTALHCDDGNPCTQDQCNAGSCVSSPVSRGTSCDDPTGGRCDGMGACVQCLTALHCDDGNPCTRDQCNAGSCEHPPSARGLSCDAELPGGRCDGSGTCVACLEDRDCGGTSCGTCERAVCLAGGTCGCELEPDGSACDCGSGTGGGYCRTGRCQRAFDRVYAAGEHSCALDSRGGLWCWGNNSSGQVGVPGSSRYSSPQPLDPAPTIDGEALQQLALGGSHGCAVVRDPADGSMHLLCWGANTRGQLGLGHNLSQGVPTEITDPLPDVNQASWSAAALGAGSEHTCLAVRYVTTGGTSDNRTYCWGRGDRSQIGQRGPPWSGDRAIPAHASPAGAGPELALGGLHSCRISPVGVAECWGDNRDRQIGNSTVASASSRVTWLVEDLNMLGSPAALVAGDRFTCARLDDGTVACWGDNDFGQLGRGTTTANEVLAAPVDGTTLPPIQQLTAGGRHACAAPASGLYCWGDNGFGQLGTGDRTASSSPSSVTFFDGTSVRSVAAGDAHSCAVTMEGRLYCWGDNGSGQLGDGTTVRRLEPVEVLLDCPGG